MLYLFFPIVISFAIGAYFFIPAVFETHYTTIDGVAISHQFDDHYPSFNQLILSPWGHAYSEVGPKDGMSFEISRIIFILVIIYLFYQVHDFIKNRKIQPLSFSLLLVYFASIYLMTSSSLWFWNIFSFLKQMQFPWRLLFIPVISGSILSTFLFNKFNSRLLIIACITLSLVFAYRYSIPQGYLNQPDIMYLEFPFSSSLNHEQLSRDFHYDKNSEYKQQLKDLAGYAHFDINTWKTAYHHYQVESTQSAHIVEHVMYFPGWKTFANDKPSDIIYDHPDYPGIITFKLPAGSHTIITKFTNDTPARRLGNSISLLTLITITLILFRKPKLK